MVYRDQVINKESARELVLYTANDSKIYDQITRPTLLVLARRKVNGTYNHAAAVKAFENILVEGIAKYSKEFGKVSLNPITRNYAARELQEEMQSNLDYFVTKMRDLKKQGLPWSMR